MRPSDGQHSLLLVVSAMGFSLVGPSGFSYAVDGSGRNQVIHFMI